MFGRLFRADGYGGLRRLLGSLESEYGVKWKRILMRKVAAASDFHGDEFLDSLQVRFGADSPKIERLSFGRHCEALASQWKCFDGERAAIWLAIDQRSFLQGFKRDLQDNWCKKV